MATEHPTTLEQLTSSFKDGGLSHEEQAQALSIIDLLKKQQMLSETAVQQGYSFRRLFDAVAYVLRQTADTNFVPARANDVLVEYRCNCSEGEKLRVNATREYGPDGTPPTEMGMCPKCEKPISLCVEHPTVIAQGDVPFDCTECDQQFRVKDGEVIQCPTCMQGVLGLASTGNLTPIAGLYECPNCSKQVTRGKGVPTYCEACEGSQVLYLVPSESVNPVDLGGTAGTPLDYKKEILRKKGITEPEIVALLIKGHKDMRSTEKGGHVSIEEFADMYLSNMLKDIPGTQEGSGDQ